MAKIIPCPDGYVSRGETDDELVAAAEAHIRDAHPEMVGKLSRDDILAMAVDE